MVSPVFPQNFVTNTGTASCGIDNKSSLWYSSISRLIWSVCYSFDSLKGQDYPTSWIDMVTADNALVTVGMQT